MISSKFIHKKLILSYDLSIDYEQNMKMDDLFKKLYYKLKIPKKYNHKNEYTKNKLFSKDPIYENFKNEFIEMKLKKKSTLGTFHTKEEILKDKKEMDNIKRRFKCFRARERTMLLNNKNKK